MGRHDRGGWLGRYISGMVGVLGADEGGWFRVHLLHFKLKD